jgi:CheY-like chemotaxis protein
MPSSSPSKRPVVLAVEDEPLILMLAVDMIADAGFEPIWAANADQAIAILESRDDIRIIFTDIHMPGSMDGLKLVQAVRGRWPPIKIIVTTSALSVADQGLMPKDATFIPKPYAFAQLANALRTLGV